MYVLGISAFFHDSAACLLQDGKPIAAAEEERFTRKKHDSAFPKQAVAYCLHSAGITISQVEAVVFYEKPFIKFERILETYLAYAPQGFRTFAKAIPRWVKKNIWIRKTIAEELNYTGKILFPEHHESHSASAFFASPFENAAILTLDGVGEWATTSYGIGKGNHIDLLAEIRFPHSLGLLYSAFTYYTGFKVNSGEYKVMGLAPYGKPLYKDLIYEKLIKVKPDGSFRLNMKYFSFATGLTMTEKPFHDLFGEPPRKPESPLTQKVMDISRSIQEVIEEIVLLMAKNLHAITGSENLCLAGGVALNCVANGRLLREGPFKNIWIQPASGDAGGALGAALVATYHYFDLPRTANNLEDKQSGSLLGSEYSASEIRAELDKQNAKYKEQSWEQIPLIAADLVNEQYVIGWFQGRMEFGPRALGARSILADARNPLMKDRVNEKIKYRERFRPFGCSVLKDKISHYFSMQDESPYMLMVAKVLGDPVTSPIPAVTHVDGSARIQTVTPKESPLFHALLKHLDEKHHCAVILNTSFNLRGEPLVCSPEDAYRCFMRTGMDYLIIGNFLLDKKAQIPWPEEIDESEMLEAD